jgi:ribose 5-phosphate isomerase B
VSERAFVELFIGLWEGMHMRVHLGCDHAGFEFKNLLAEHLTANGHEVVDHGAHEYDALDDYPPFCVAAAQAVVADEGSLGVVMGGSGNGEQIAANKVAGVRAALAWSVETASLARQHNNANVIGLGARMHSTEDAFAIVDAFLDTPFSGDERHQRRIDLLSRFEGTGAF